MAIEDGVSLAVMLSRDVTREEIPERLKLYEKARHNRASTVQQMTRESSKPQSMETSQYQHMSLSYIANIPQWKQ